MSSKLVKGGGIQAEAVAWRSVAAPAPQTAQSNQESQPSHPKIEELQAKVAGLERELDQRVKAALQQGAQQGEAAVRQQLGAQTEAALKRLARVVEEISGMRQRCRFEAEQDVVKLSLAIARRIINRELTIDSSAILGLIKAALEKLNVREVHRLRVHPEHAELVKKQLEQIGLPQRCEVLGDPALERGAAILETTHGSLDASVETQLFEIERGFADLVKHSV